MTKPSFGKTREVVTPNEGMFFVKVILENRGFSDIIWMDDICLVDETGTVIRPCRPLVLYRVSWVDEGFDGVEWKAGHQLAVLFEVKKRAVRSFHLRIGSEDYALGNLNS